MRKTLLAVGSLMLVGGISAAQRHPTPPAPLATPPEVGAAMQGMGAFHRGRYLEAVDILERTAFNASGDVANDFAFQALYQIRPLLNGYAPPSPLESSSPPLNPEDAAKLRVAVPEDALRAITAAAARTNIVILNEAHHSPRDRAFALQVARALRPLGYTLLAAEAFANAGGEKTEAAMAQLARDGYPRTASGHYLKDPVFADFVRQSLALGYRPIAYEQTQAQQPPKSGIPEREQAQAENLAAVVARNSQAKILIHVGFSHVTEAPISRGNSKIEWMAARLKRMTGIDPLTVDQTFISETAESRAGREAHALAFERIGRASIWRYQGRALVLGPYQGAVDLQVVHPRMRLVHGRPDWLVSMGRKPHVIPAHLLPKHGRRLVQAFLRGEAEDAIPIDQVLVEAGKPIPMLMLPSRKVRYAVQDPA